MFLNYAHLYKKTLKLSKNMQHSVRYDDTVRATVAQEVDQVA